MPTTVVITINIIEYDTITVSIINILSIILFMDKLELFIKTIDIELLKIGTNVIFVSLYKYLILLLIIVHVNNNCYKIGCSYISYNLGSSKNKTLLILSKFDWIISVINGYDCKVLWLVEQLALLRILSKIGWLFIE